MGGFETVDPSIMMAKKQKKVLKTGQNQLKPAFVSNRLSSSMLPKT